MSKVSVDNTISMVLDKRRKKKNGKYPVKLRVFTSTPRKQKLYNTRFEFSEEEFSSIWETVRPRAKYKQTRKMLQAIEQNAWSVANELEPFDFELFEKKLFRKRRDGTNVSYLYGERIKELRSMDKISTANNYGIALKSFGRFCESEKKKIEELSLFEVNTNWLNRYEHYMVEQGKSLTTVSIYIRTLKTIFNKAIEEKEIESGYFPFGKGKYIVPKVSNKKKALTKEQLKQLFEARPKSPQEEKAKDFWFFSFACNGINIKDILLLKNKDLDDDKITFYRAKTISTSKGNLKKITVYLNEFAKEIIDKYRSKSLAPNDLVFSILEGEQDPIKQHTKIKNFTRFINQHIRKICEEHDLPIISTYWARHSFATTVIRKGGSMEFVQESLGHSSMNTTKAYFAGFDDDTKKDFADQIMNFG
ncbi:tyrosine-type recombinase/integrase [Flagellimonas sp.]|uniref:tyrosine-type recombinase/integrase n=1 Tax=Flagellimonas sp. TaxID=2058762 RepID=UPI003BAA6917